MDSINYDMCEHSLAPSPVVDIEKEPIRREAPKRKYKAGQSCCQKFIIDRNGQIGLSLRNLTVSICIISSTFLLGILITSCVTGAG